MVARIFQVLTFVVKALFVFLGLFIIYSAFTGDGSPAERIFIVLLSLALGGVFISVAFSD